MLRERSSLSVELAAYVFHQPICLVEQYPAVYVHEVALDVELQHMTLPDAVLRARSDVVFQTVYAEVRPLALAARIAVVNEQPLQKRVHIAVYVMVHHAVAEIRRHYLAHHRLAHHEAHTGADDIRAVEYAPREFVEFFLETQFEAHPSRRVLLVPRGILVSTQQVDIKFMHGHLRYVVFSFLRSAAGKDAGRPRERAECP